MSGTSVRTPAADAAPATDAGPADRAAHTRHLAWRVKAGTDPEAVPAFVGAIDGLVYTIAREYAPDRSQVDDVAQECRVRVLRALERYDGSRPLTPWLQTVIRNCARNYCRAQRRWRAIELGETPEVLGREHRPLDRAEAREAAGIVRQAVEALPAVYREVVARRYFAGEPCEQVAGVLGIPVGTVKNRLFRARALLARRLTHGLDLPVTV